MNTLLVIIRKEFRQFFRNSFLPKLCIMFPIVVMLIMPLVTNMEVRHVGVAVVDSDMSPLSRRVVSDISASEYTDVVGASSHREALGMVEQQVADIVLEIPRGWQASLGGPAPLSVSLEANSVNATKGTLGMQYVRQIIATAQMRVASASGVEAGFPEIAVLHLFNPTLNYRHFMIPALMIMLLVMLCGFLPALNLVGEKERGTIEQINVSPVGQFVFTLGKVIPYWIIGFVVLSIAVIIAWAVYGLVPLGGIFTIFVVSLLFIVVMSGMAVMFANFSDNMQQVMLVMFFFVMIFILMSGLMTPVQSMPDWAQTVTLFIPASYYVEPMRACYLRGVSLQDMWLQVGALAAFAVLFTGLAALTYRKRS